MARIYTDGAEAGDDSRIHSASRLGSHTYASTTQKRSGNYSYNDDNADFVCFGVYSVAKTELYLRFALRNNTLITGFASPLKWMSGASTVIGQVQVSMGGSGAGGVKALVGASVVETSAGITWNINEWHVLEVHIKIHSSTGRIEVKFDGTQVINYTGNTATAGADFDRLFFYPSWAGSGTQGYLDDIGVNDTTTGNDASWCGDGGCLAALVPDGAGAYTDLAANTGTPYQAVDDLPSNGDTDYVYSVTPNDKSTYTLSNLAGLPSGASIARVWVEAVARESQATGDKIATLLRSASTDDQGADQTLTLAYARYLSAEYLVDPADSAAWTTTKVNALQAGVVVR